MKNLFRSCGFRALALAVLAVGMSFGPAAAQKSAADVKPNTPEDAARIRALMAKQKEHEILGRLAGSWEATLTATTRGNPPRELPSPATLDLRWILDGYFLESDETFQPGGQTTIRSRAVYGYNSFKKHFYRILFQGGDPREYVSTGTWDAATRTLTFTGPEHNAATGDDFERRDIFRLIGDDQLAYELAYRFQDGSEIKPLRGTYTRKKG